MDRFDFAQMNNRGVSLLASGDNKRACEAFRDALQMSRTTVAMDGIPSKPFSAAERHVSVRTVVPIQSLVHTEESAFFVYGQAVLSNPSALADNDGQSSNVMLESAIVIFNMALAHHGKCLDSPGGSSSDFQKAVRFYDLCVKLVRQAAPTVSSSADRELCFLLALGSLNNKTQIFYSLCEFDQVNILMNQLMSLLVESREHSFCLLRDEEISGILLNIVLLQNTIAVAASA